MNILVSPEDEELLAEFRWMLDAKGYVVRYENRTVFRLHRAVIGAKKGELVDHINGNPLDNRRENLRICTHSQNMRNLKQKRSNSSTGRANVIKGRIPGRFDVQVRVDGKRHRIFDFKDIEAAGLAARNLVTRLHGEFSKFLRPSGQ